MAIINVTLANITYICTALLLSTNYTLNTFPGICGKEPPDGRKTNIVTNTSIVHLLGYGLYHVFRQLTASKGNNDVVGGHKP